MVKQNRNAHKWTEECVTEHLMAIREDATTENTMYLGRALVREGLYAEVWSYWKKIFVKNENIIEAMLHIEAIFEARLFEGALKKEIPAWLAIFGLRNNHHWTDRHEPEPEEKRQSPILVQLSDDKIMLVDKGRSDVYSLYEREEQIKPQTP